ncbi:MAG: hypothetical protein MJK13_18190, partial [Pseudomonadales bacterium]|nr:hypothetical protein [Pseudomonadales bacterium]
MIIQASEINISSKHEKSESRTLSTMTSAYLSNNLEPSYLSEHSELAERFAALLQQSNQSGAAAGQEDDTNSNSILVMTKEGFKFRSAEERKDFQDQQLLTQIKLFRSLLQAILAPGKTLATDNSDLLHAGQMNDPLCCQHHGSEDPPIPQQPIPQQRGGISIQISFQSTETVTEHESLEFSSSGTVTTADGLDFS